MCLSGVYSSGLEGGETDEWDGQSTHRLQLKAGGTTQLSSVALFTTNFGERNKLPPLSLSACPFDNFYPLICTVFKLG